MLKKYIKITVNDISSLFFVKRHEKKLIQRIKF